jgi:hypothetical protein
MSGRDPTRNPVPINPPEHKGVELWRAMWLQCNVQAGFSSGPPEQDLVDQNDDKHPSEIKRMKEAVGEKPKQ